MKKVLFLVPAFVILGLVASATASPITSLYNLYNTGVDSSGTPLPDGTVGDPHYTLVSAPASLTSLATVVRTATGGYPIPPWIADDSVSAWIGPDTTSDLAGPEGNYDYQTAFSLPGPGTVTITGRWSSDNNGLGISLNGGSLTNPVTDIAAFENWSSFTISGAASASNTLDFNLQNAPYTSSDNPTGLRVEITSVDFTPVPEPSVLVGLVGSGLVGLIGLVWRRRK